MSGGTSGYVTVCIVMRMCVCVYWYVLCYILHLATHSTPPLTKYAAYQKSKSKMVNILKIINNDLVPINHLGTDTRETKRLDKHFFPSKIG